MNSPQNEIDMTPWQKTFEKQERLLLKREQRAKEGASNDLETSTADTTSDVGDDSKRVLPVHLTSPRVATAVAPIKPTVAPIPVRTAMSGDSDVDGVFVPQAVSPATDSPKANLSSSKAAAFMDDSDQDLICRAMTSFVISSPPRKPARTTSPFTTPGKRRKYYVVSAGKRTGVFDSWPYVQSLTSGVSGNCQKSYATYDEALDVYQDLKANGLIRIVRNRGDENLFGPIEDAME